MSLVLSGDTGVQGNSGAFVAGTAVASTSGTSIDFTSIPSWVKRITVMFSGFSTSGTSITLVQIGDSGGIENTGYLGTTTSFASSTVGVSAAVTTGFSLLTNNAASLYNGTATICLLDAATNLWCFNGSIASSADARQAIGSSSKSLSGTLDRIRITTVNGTDTFDAGSINILYE